MMKVKFIGDPSGRDNTPGVEFKGVHFVRNVPVTVASDIAAKLASNPHFEVKVFDPNEVEQLDDEGLREQQASFNEAMAQLVERKDAERERALADLAERKDADTADAIAHAQAEWDAERAAMQAEIDSLTVALNAAPPQDAGETTAKAAATSKKRA
jgi:hypothetical protein